MQPPPSAVEWSRFLWDSLDRHRLGAIAAWNMSETAATGTLEAIVEAGRRYDLPEVVRGYEQIIKDEKFHVGLGRLLLDRYAESDDDLRRGDAGDARHGGDHGRVARRDRPRVRKRPAVGYTLETIVIPPRDFCRSVVCTRSGGELEGGGHVVADPHGERLAELALVAELHEVELERLRLQAERLREVLDRGDVHVGLERDRAERRELVARHLDALDAGVRERLEPGVVLQLGVAERLELGGWRGGLHGAVLYADDAAPKSRRSGRGRDGRRRRARRWPSAGGASR